MLSARRCLTLLAAVCLVATLAIPALAQQAPPAEGTEADLIAVLQSGDAPLFDKAKACQRLAVIGTKECVPVLAGLLDDDQLSHYARYGLEPLPDAAVDEALRDALGKVKGGHLVGVIDSIGVRRDTGAVDALQRVLTGSDADAAAAAASALGRIATPEALASLRSGLDRPEPLRTAVADACLTAAEVLMNGGQQQGAASVLDAVRKADVATHLKVAALHGVIRARGKDGLPLVVECLRSEDQATFRTGLRMAHDFGGPDVARAVITELKLPGPEETPAEGLVIRKAEYGAGDRVVDVTEQVIAAVQSGEPVVASNDLAGDPAPRQVKELRVVYVKDGKEETVTVPEKEQLTLDGKLAAISHHPRQVLFLYTLGDLGEEVALPVILEAAQNDAWDVRGAAIRVLGELGDDRAVPVLLAAAVEGGGLAQTAEDSLIDLEGEGVDAALAGALDEAKENERVVLIRLVGQRSITSAVPALKEALDDPDPEVVRAAILALGTTVGLNDLSVLIDRLVVPDTPEEAAAAKEALKKAVLRMPDRDATAAKLLAAMARASTAAKVDLLDLVGVVGGDKALQGVASAAKSGDEEVQDASTRVLGEWMSPDAATVLLDLATTGPEKFRVRTLRGYIRIARQLDLSPEERIEMCRKALQAARRDAERALALEVLGRHPTAASLALVVPYLDDAGAKEAASDAAVSIAEKVIDAHPGPVAEAMQKAAEVTSNAELRNRAGSLAKRAKRKLGNK